MPEGTKEVVVSKLIDDVPTLLILSGVGLIVLGLAGGVTYHQWLLISDLAAEVGAVAAGTIILARYLRIYAHS